VPIRFSILLHTLEKWDLTTKARHQKWILLPANRYRKASWTILRGKAMRHVILVAEFVPAKFLNLRVGYNYQRRQELKLTPVPVPVGFSWGFGSTFQNSASTISARCSITLWAHATM
jgi:hypothetical protein